MYRLQNLPLHSGAKVVACRNAIIDAKIDDEIVALSIEHGTCYGMNRVGSRIWTLLAKPIRICDLCAALLADLNDIKDGELRLKIGQGVDMGRPSLLLTRVRKQNGKVASIHVGGSCVKMMEGTFRLDGKG